MSRPLKMFMRGKRITMLQEILQRMGYPMHDQAGLFGASTRDGIKDFQKRQGLKPTGAVDEDLLNRLQHGSSPSKQEASSPVETSSPLACNQHQLDALINLLIGKGIITQAELDEPMPAAKALRITQPPLL